MSEAKQAALAALTGVAVEPTGLVSYQSRGKLLALGEADALPRCDVLPDSVDLTRIDCSGHQVEIVGHLGAFRVNLTDASGQITSHSSDAILDLHEQSLISVELPPPGYFHAPDAVPTEVQESLQNLTGQFEKPKYFAYDASICAHSVNGRTVCARCIDSCPAGAIASIEEVIEVDPNLCQGGGSCATACPSGAIRYLYPNLKDQGKRVREMVRTYRAQGGAAPTVVFHAAETSTQAFVEAGPDRLPVAVEELASVGMDLCLSILAAGAGQIVLLADDTVPSRSRQTLEAQLRWLRVLLVELGLDPNTVSLSDADSPVAKISTNPDFESSQQDVPLDKRNAYFLALDHLVAQLTPDVDRVELPSPAPFGEVMIDADKCTLCMACISACPGRALQDGSNREVPEVFFIESNCLQCGACVQTCPEDAMTLHSRLLLDREARIRSRVLNQDKPFACISCGKPFAPTSVITKMQDKLKDHYMFNSDRALDRLKMCDDCRVADIVQDPDAMGGQFDPLKNFRQ